MTAAGIQGSRTGSEEASEVAGPSQRDSETTWSLSKWQVRGQTPESVSLSSSSHSMTYLMSLFAHVKYGNINGRIKLINTGVYKTFYNSAWHTSVPYTHLLLF